MFDETTEDRSEPRLTQLSVFLENRLGALLGMTKALERQGINICAVSVSDAADHAVIRLVVDKPTLAAASLEADGYHLITTDILGVALPAEKPGGMRRLLQALLAAELDVHYIYAVANQRLARRAILALHVEEIHRAAEVLSDHGMDLVSQDEIA